MLCSIHNKQCQRTPPRALMKRLIRTLHIHRCIMKRALHRHFGRVPCTSLHAPSGCVLTHEFSELLLSTCQCRTTCNLNVHHKFHTLYLCINNTNITETNRQYMPHYTGVVLDDYCTSDFVQAHCHLSKHILIFFAFICIPKSVTLNNFTTSLALDARRTVSSA